MNQTQQIPRKAIQGWAGPDGTPHVIDDVGQVWWFYGAQQKWLRLPQLPDRTIQVTVEAITKLG